MEEEEGISSGSDRGGGDAGIVGDNAERDAKPLRATFGQSE